MDKFELTSEFKVNILGKKVFRIKALVDIKYAKAGDLGGYIGKKTNLAQSGDAWVSGDAQVFGNAWVYSNAQVSGDAWVYGNAQVSGDAWVFGNAQVFGNAWVSGAARVYGNAQVSGDAWVKAQLDFIQSRYCCHLLQSETSVKIRIGCECRTVADWEKQKEKLADGYDREWWDAKGKYIYEFLKDEVERLTRR